MKTLVLGLLLALAYQPCAQALQFQLAPPCGRHASVGEVCSLPILALHPTQFTLGMIEVRARAAQFERKKPAKFAKYMKKHNVPVVIGPDGVFYMTDHHHLSRALYEDGVRTVNAQVTHDWSNLNRAQFWSRMESTKQVYLYEDGRGPLSPSELPNNILQLKNDYYRSLAWAVCSQTQAFKKEKVLFFSFYWANFFRARIPDSLVRNHFEQAVQLGAQLARSPAAKGMPGYRG